MGRVRQRRKAASSASKKDGPITRLRQKFELFHFDQTPAFLQDNPYILRGYRASYSWAECVQSIFKLHNETLNIWTHLLGCIFFLCLMIFMLATLSPFGIDHLPAHHQHDVSAFISNSSTLLRHHQHNESAVVGDAPMPPDRLVDRVRRWGSSRYHKIASHLPHMEHLTDTLASTLNSAVTAGEELEAMVEQRIHNANKGLADMLQRVEANFAKFKDHVAVMCAACRLDHLRRVRDNLEASVAELRQTVASAGDDAFDFTMEYTEHLLEYLALVERRIEDLLLLQDTNTTEYLPRWPLAFYALCAMMCMLLSAMYHTFFCKDHAACKQFQKLDFSGICLLIGGSCIPIIFYGFYCTPELQKKYIVMVATMTVIGFCVVMSDKMSQHAYVVPRTLTFVAMGATGAWPLGHFLMLYGWDGQFWYLIAMGASYLVGAFIYAVKWPESWKPGKFDIFFSSHQLWHMLVVLAAWCHWLGVNHWYQWRMQRACPAPL